MGMGYRALPLVLDTQNGRQDAAYVCKPIWIGQSVRHRRASPKLTTLFMRCWRNLRLSAHILDELLMLQLVAHGAIGLAVDADQTTRWPGHRQS